MESVHGYIDEHYARFRQELFEFLRIPSVSARSEHVADMVRCARWLAQKLGEAGFDEVSVEDTPGHPIVVGEWRGAGQNAPTLLIYGHYDVQPVEPLELWTSPPFEPALRDGRIYARGAADDKGQLFLYVKAVEAHLSRTGRLPVNVILLAEGEEEVGSGNLMPFVERNAERLRTDGIVISDSNMLGPGLPTIGASLRGLAFFELEVTGPARDLHSGSYGGSVANPATALARMIASCHDENMRITVPGFYDDVRLDPEYQAAVRSLPFDEAAFRIETGAPSLTGESGYSLLERLWMRPTLEMNGLISGYTGEGPKTVLPSWARAKLSCRLVPDQKPERIAQLLEEHLQRVTPPGVSLSFQPGHAALPWRARLDGPLHEAAERALESVYGRAPVFAGEGGTIPIVPEFERVLSAPALLLGFGLPGANAHAPDEWMEDEQVRKGAHVVARLLTELG